jgi:hypothetical protein
MHIANLGRVLTAMAEYSRKRADERRDHLGSRNTELLWAISHILIIGASKCLEIVEEEQDERKEPIHNPQSNEGI